MPDVPEVPDVPETSELPLEVPPEVPDVPDIPEPPLDVPPVPELPLLSWFFCQVGDELDVPEVSDDPDDGLVTPEPFVPEVPDVPELPEEVCATATPAPNAEIRSAAKTLFI